MGPRLKKILEDLNPDTIGPRNPVFLHAPMPKVAAGTLRICLKDQSAPRKLKFPRWTERQRWNATPMRETREEGEDIIRTRKGTGG